MIICTSKTCKFKKVCGRQRDPTKNDKIFDLTDSCCKITGFDLFIHKDENNVKKEN